MGKNVLPPVLCHTSPRSAVNLVAAKYMSYSKLEIQPTHGASQVRIAQTRGKADGVRE